jgi:Domain of unknown function (DUF4390)
MTCRLSFLCVIAVLSAGALLRAAERLRIVPITSGDQVVVTVELADAFTDEVRGAISSGLRTTFTYDVELRMVVPGWVDQTVATAVVTTTDQYDNLTRRHSLSRAVDGRIEEVVLTEDESVVRRWLTTLSRMPLCRTSKLDPSRDYYVRIRARVRPRGGSLLGWAGGITGMAKFTFIP